MFCIQFVLHADMLFLQPFAVLYPAEHFHENDRYFPELQGQIPSHERVAQAARVKPEHTSCPDQGSPGCPRPLRCNPPLLLPHCHHHRSCQCRSCQCCCFRCCGRFFELRAHSASWEGEVWEHLLPRPGRTRLPPTVTVQPTAAAPTLPPPP